MKATSKPKHDSHPTPSVTGVVLLVSDHLGYFRDSLIDNLLKFSQPFDELLIVASGLSSKAMRVVVEGISRFPEHWNCRVIRVPLGTVGANRNVGLNEATSDLVSFLDADDLYAPDYYGFIVKFFTEQQFDIFLHGYFTMEGKGDENFTYPTLKTVDSVMRFSSESFRKLSDSHWDQHPGKVLETNLLLVRPNALVSLHQGHMTVKREMPLRFHTNPQARNEDGIFLNMALNANFEIAAVEIPLSSYRVGTSANPLRYRLARAPEYLLKKLHKTGKESR